MRHKTYFYIVSLVFLTVGLAHLARVLLGWDLVVDILDIPAWVSWIAVFALGYLSYMGFRLASGAQD